jgi:beta-glucosidase
VKFSLGLFDHPYVENPKEADRIVYNEEARSFTEQLSRKTLVLLKNRDQLLPLHEKKLKRILVTGPLATEVDHSISRYGPSHIEVVSVLEGIKKRVGGELEVVYAQGCEVVDAHWPQSEILPEPTTPAEQKGIDEAVAQARDSDVVIAVLGETHKQVGESRSRTSLELPGHQLRLLQALHATGKPIVLVLINGRPLSVNWAEAHIPAILEAWFPGAPGGTAVAGAIFGDFSPGGKLPVTFPKSVGQIPLNFPFKPASQAGQPNEGPNGTGSTRVLGALYPFGHGLSYTTFAYGNLQVGTVNPRVQQNIEVSVSITNTGSIKGDEVVQLYLRDLVSSVTTYDSKLRGFERVSLEPGETAEVGFLLTPDDLALLDKNMNHTVESGEFEILIGSSSEDIRLSKVIKVEGIEK